MHLSLLCRAAYDASLTSLLCFVLTCLLTEGGNFKVPITQCANVPWRVNTPQVVPDPSDTTFLNAMPCFVILDICHAKHNIFITWTLQST